MSSTIAHVTSASFVAVTFANVQPDETPYIIAALVSAGIVDFDHLFYLVKDRSTFQQYGLRGRLHYARSVFHELLGLLLAGVLAALVFWVNRRLASVFFIAFAVHLAEDWMLGKARPLAPVDMTETQLFAMTFNQKVWVDVAIVAMFGVLWILYLFGAV
jgi:hypothetical protein